MFTFCSKESSFRLDADIDQGAINTNAVIFSTSNLGLNSGVVIRSEENNFGLAVNYLNDSLDEVAIDFDQYSVLGYGASGTCEVQFVRRVEINNLDSTINYFIRVNELGNCEREEFSNNWVLVPRIGDAYEVFFEKIQK
ncbi:MAG: hypothetical protein ACJAY8_000199 [Sphingobacteriales bacterium]